MRLPAGNEGDQPANPIPEGEVAVQTVTETEVFHVFTWAPKPRPRPERAPRRDPQPPREGGEKREARPRRDGDRSGPRPEGKPDGRPDRKGGDFKGGDAKGRGGKPGRDRREEGGRSFEARPPKKNDRIDPDNPFAAALMGLRDKI